MFSLGLEVVRDKKARSGHGPPDICYFFQAFTLQSTSITTLALTEYLFTQPRLPAMLLSGLRVSQQSQYGENC